MLASGIIILAALCGVALGAGDPTIEINIEKVTVVPGDNSLLGEWSATVEPGKPVNKLTLKTPTNAAMPADLRVKFKVKIGGSPLPDVDTLGCDALKDKVIGEGIVAAGSPFPAKCPIPKGEYVVLNYWPDKEKMPPGLPDGKLEVKIEIYLPKKDPIVTINVEGTIKHNAPGMG